MVEKTPLAQILSAILAEDRTLLSRREDLLMLLEQRVTPALMRDYRSFQKALQGSTVGEMFLAADGATFDEQEQVRTEATEALLALGMQARAVQRVVDTLAQSLDWPDSEDDVETDAVYTADAASADSDTADTFAISPQDADEAIWEQPAPDDMIPAMVAPPPAQEWACRCGHTGNKGRFCVRCGTSRAEGEVAQPDPAALWTCICGHSGNKGKFCVKCGRSRQEGEQAATNVSRLWTCRCGHHDNRGKFCTACGAPRAEGEVATWTCVCGYQGNSGKFCVKCGRPRG